MSIVPDFKYTVPTLTHKKLVPYIDFPIVFNDIVTNEPFYIEFNWTFVTSDQANTTLRKWNGSSWTDVTGWSNPEFFFGKGFYSVTTATAAYVTVTEHPADLPNDYL